MKYLLLILVIFITSCTSVYVGTGLDLGVDLQKEINKSISDGFPDQDTTELTYIIK